MDFHYYIGGGGGVAVLIIVLVLCCCYRRRKSNTLRTQQNVHSFEKCISLISSSADNNGFLRSPKLSANELTENTDYASNNKYGDLGRLSASPFLGSVQNARLISSRDSIISSDSRKNSASENFKNLPSSNVVSVNQSSKKVAPYETCELKPFSHKDRSISNLENTAVDDDTFLPSMEIQRFASTGYALKQNKREFNLQIQEIAANFEAENKREDDDNDDDDNDYEVPVEVELCKTFEKGDKDVYTDLTFYENKETLEKESEYADFIKERVSHGDYHYSEYAYQNPPIEDHSPGHYEVPSEEITANESNGQYLNLNAKQNKLYTNLDYEVPCMNPTQTDSEDVYIEFQE